MAVNRNSKTEFVLSAIAFIAAAVPIWMLVFGGMAAMRSMGMSIADVMSKPPDKAMMMPMMKAIHKSAMHSSPQRLSCWRFGPMRPAITRAWQIESAQVWLPDSSPH
jgi:hypothetical protein